MKAFTRERLLKIQQWRETYGPGSNVVLPAEEAEELARIALASLEADPVLYAAEETLAYAKHGELHLTCLSEPMGDAVIPLYTAPPAPVVPDEVNLAIENLKKKLVDCNRYNYCSDAVKRVEDSFRAAMLQGAEPVSNRDELPGGWVACSERMPERDVDVQVYCADKKEQMVGYMERNEAEGWFRFASLPNGGGVYCKPTHWMPLPAAPQEVKSE
ncbi:DUF551 domain-containing protein [Citrobacter sedlakii]|uniref:DUF551 domain-containing protein n=1 Tax=Citrobacter TaxID=544 RepID=UPI001969E626|nr:MULTISPECIES: DUF551 domain-containing protein [Citrobacter]MBM9568996.1 DUF551 domain-containing protein [Citrobacter sedlakii]HBL4691960.1 DUF551 domain-containing protein [Citrobacter sedlakii]HBL4706195.1 DUF551 domain-containing protein [Citrobacter sedlakii]HBL4720848.1 DUF551 domain-containing protein [Citrobacter sedlakii]HCA7841798.1 DUF551 domain-containing protein [Citrobacter sedlakii]